MRRWRFGAAVLVGALVLATVGCAGGGRSGEGGAVGAPEAAAPGSDPAPGSEVGARAALRSDPLQVSELRPLELFGYDFRQVPVVDRARFDVTSIRGACGAELPTPFATGGSTRIFFSTFSLVVEARTPWNDRAKDFFAAAQADVRPGCAPFTDAASAGATVTLSSAIDLHRFGVEQAGWNQAVGSAPRPGVRQVALVRDDDELVLLAVISTPAPPSLDDFQRLAQLAFGGGDGAALQAPR